MGDANFSGGGSVTWEVVNSDGETGGGNRQKCTGKDKDPKGPGGMFRVTVNDQIVALLPVDGARIQVSWTSQAAATTGGTTTSVAASAPKASGKQSRKG